MVAEKSARDAVVGPLPGPEWWEEAVVYQVYPRSFMDSNGDGVGDLRGIASRLAYLEWLGIDAVWLSPIFPSPMRDFGYDISDYTAVDPLFGTMEDLESLIGEAHRRGIRVLLDLVPNHTSDEHPWFIESRASKHNPRRDWYIWRDGRGDGPPNNWLSNFGGSAWELDQRTGQFYYHAFLPEQPDLNWRNPDVRRAMYDVMRFWFSRGIDGFRIDVLWHLLKDAELRDNPPNPHFRGLEGPYRSLLPVYSTDQPEVMEVVNEMRAVADEFGDRVLIGEIYLPLERLVRYYGESNRGIHLPFNFQLLLTEWRAPAVAEVVAKYEALLPPGAWPNWVLGNHDRPRVATRIGAAQARVAALLLLTLRGTPTIYYGDEIAMRNVPIPRDRLRDPVELRLPGLGLGRDPVRTPMQWDSSPGAGFTPGEPWLPLAGDCGTENVERQSADPGSMLSLYRRLLALRREQPALRVGSFRLLDCDEHVFAYERAHGGVRWIAVLNFSGEPQTYRLPADDEAEVAVSTVGLGGAVIAGELELAPNEALVARVLA